MCSRKGCEKARLLIAVRHGSVLINAEVVHHYADEADAKRSLRYEGISVYEILDYYVCSCCGAHVQPATTEKL